MKRIISITVLLLLISTTSFTQVLELELYTDTLVKGKPGSELEIKGDLINNTESPLTVTITRLENNLPANWTSNISTDLCLPHYLSVSNVTIAALSKQEFIFHFVTAADYNNQGNALLEFRNSADTNLIFAHRFYCYTDSTLLSLDESSYANNNEVKVFPNPNNGSFSLSYHAYKQEDVNLSIMSLSGQHILKIGSITVSEGLNLIPISYPLSPGTYLLHISNSDKTSYLPLNIIE